MRLIFKLSAFKTICFPAENCPILKFPIVWIDLIIRSSLRLLWRIMRHFRMIFHKEIWNVVNRKAFLFPYFASIDLLYCKQNWPGLPHPLALPSSMVRKGYDDMTTEKGGTKTVNFLSSTINVLYGKCNTMVQENCSLCISGFFLSLLLLE